LKPVSTDEGKLATVNNAEIPAYVKVYVAPLEGGAETSSSETKTITLKNGKTFEVETKRGLPLPYNSREIRILNIGTQAAIPVLPSGNEGQAAKIPWIWALTAELKGKGSFTVTVTTPIDEKLSTTFEAKGPGKISQTFFPQADYPTMWEGIEDPGTHWFPFHFSFEDKTSKKRFEFTQWAQQDSQSLEEARTRIQKLMKEGQQLPKHGAKPDVTAVGELPAGMVEGTLADRVLQADIKGMIRILEGAYHPNCKLQIVKQLHSADKRGKERWDVKSCDATSSYDVEMVASPRGGTDFHVRKSALEQEKKTEP